MKIMVTGGAGFIGSHIVDAFVELGNDVVVLDNLSTGLKENINSEARFYKADICDENAVAEVVSREKPHIVSHQAAQIDVRKSVEDPIYDARANIIGSLNVITSASRFGVKKIIYASTAAVYGEPLSFPVNESSPICPISPYGISKHTVEHYLQSYSLDHGLKYTVLRYSNVFGPRQDPKGEAGVIAIFTQALLEGRTPTIFGDGEQTRDYLFVEDVARGNALAASAGDNCILNLGTATEITVNKLFSVMKKAADSTLTPVYKPRRSGEIDCMRLDASRARQELQWEPKVDFEDGISRTIEYYRGKREGRLRN